MRIKKYSPFFFAIVIFSSCVIDHFEPFFYINNNFDYNIRIYYSNNTPIDTTFLVNGYTIIRKAELYRQYMDAIFEKKQYQKNPDKKLYLFIFDENKIDSLRKAGIYSLLEQAHKSFIERKTIDILNITAKDTIYIGANKKSE